MKTPFSIIIVAFSGSLLLTGCGNNSGFADLQQQLTDIRAKPSGRMEPMPEYKASPIFTYAAHQFRSPFQVPVKEAEAVKVAGVAVQPSLDRIPEYLEGFSIESLRMAGTMQKGDSSGSLFALIEDAESDAHRLEVGNYLGKNHGRIVEVTEASVALVEIVPDGRGGWVERPKRIMLEE